MTPEEELFPEDEQDELEGAPMQVGTQPPQAGLTAAPDLNDFLSRVEAQRAGKHLAAARDAGEQTAPDQAARVLRLQAKTGLPADLIRANPDAIEREVSRSDFDPARFRRESPIVADWMAQSPEHAAILAPEVTTAQQLEATMKSIMGFTKDMTVGRIRAELDVYRSAIAGFAEFPGMVARGAGETIDVMARRTAPPFMRDLADQITFTVGEGEDAISGNALQVPSVLLRLGGNSIQSVVEKIEVPEERSNYLTDVARGVGQLVAQIATQVITRGQATASSLFFMGADIQAQQVDDAIERGLPVGDDQRDLAIMAGGAVTGITEKLGLDFLLDRLPPNVRSIIGRWIGDIALAGGGEAIQEMTESILQNTITRVLADPSYDIMGLDTLYEGGVGFGAGAVGRALVNLAVPARRRRMSEQTREKVSKLNETLQGMNLGQVAPEQLESLVANIRERTGQESLWIDLKAWRTFFQSQDLDPEKAAADIIGDGGASYREAVAATGRVEIPIEKYAAHIATNENAASLEGSVSFAADQLTADQAIVYEREQDKIIEEFKRFAAGEEPKGDFGTVYQEVLGELLAIMPRSTAEVVAFAHVQILATQAERNNISLKELAKIRPIQFKREVPEVLKQMPRQAETDEGFGLDVLLDRLRGGDIPTARQAYGPSIMDLLREWGIRDDGGELSGRDVDFERLPGQRNIVREDGITLDAARERLVELGFLNELSGDTASTGEQDVLDLVDQEMGGNPQFSRGQLGDQRLAQLREALLTLENFLQQMDADPQELTNDEIAQIVQSGIPATAMEQIYGNILDQRVAHGSPHLFNKFSTEFLGTGEGFQAFGWGLYFAQAVAVANKYRSTKSERRFTFENAPERPEGDGPFRWQRTEEQAAYDDAVRAMESLGIAEAIARMQTRLEYWQAQLNEARAIGGQLRAVEQHTSMVKFHQDRLAVMEEFQEQATEVEEGYLYEVEIRDDQFDSMLLWDRTWDEQPEVVRQRLIANGFNPKNTKDLTGESIYWQVAARLYPTGNNLMRGAELASKWLAGIGIPGNRFWDQESRTEPDLAKRTENIVLFNGADATILSVNGEPVTTLFQSRTLRTGRETLRRFGLDPNGRYTTREVAAALEARQREKYGVISDRDTSREAARKIANWMVAEIEFELENPEDSGVGWYSTKYQAALDGLGEIFPELLTDPLARQTMTALIAITSDGQKVVSNFRQARDIYGRFRETGKFTLERSTAREASVDINLKRLQTLYDEMGVEAAHAYLMTEMTVSELNAKMREAGLKPSSDYQAHVTVPVAALEFGPKLGAFYANLNGAHGYLTMDRWWSRTFNRYRGTLLTAPTKGSLDRFRELLGKPDLSDDEAIAATVEHAERLEARGFKTELAILVGKSEPTAAQAKKAWMTRARKLAGAEFDAMLQRHNIERAANNIYKNTFTKLNDAPFRASDRTFMIEATEMARKTLARKGVEVTIADIQAILWYYEKKLYGALGAPASGSISYEEAAARVVAEFNATDSDGDSAAAREVLEAVAEGVPPGDRRFGGDQDRTLYQIDPEVTPPIWSDAFRSWFGGSAVVDDEGMPLVVYHGTKQDFDSFRADVPSARLEDGGMAAPGFYFSANPENAKGWATYSKQREEYRQQAIEKQAIADDRKASREERAEARAWLRDYNMWVAGTNLMPVYLSLQNPMVYDAKGKRWNETGGLSALVEEAKKKGHDGLIVTNMIDPPAPGAPGPWGAAQYIAFSPTQIKSAVGNNGQYDPENPNILFQDAEQDERDLIARHNLSFENVRHALRIGGIPVPSVSVGRLRDPFMEFGDITLIGDSSLVDPRSGAKVFGADVYSPRYPQVDYGLTPAKIQQILDKFAAPYDFGRFDVELQMMRFDDVIRRGPMEFAAQPLIMHHFMVERGIEPPFERRVNKEGERLRERMTLFGLGERIAELSKISNKSSMYFPPEAHAARKADLESEEFQTKAIQYLVNQALEGTGLNPQQWAERERMITLQLLNTTKGAAQIEALWNEMWGISRPAEIKHWETRQAMMNKLRELGLEAEYSAWAAEQWNALGTKERIRRVSEGEGRVRYEPHRLANVVRAMKFRIRGGEDGNGSIYGLGPLRARFTPQFKSITQIKDNRDRIVSEQVFENIKEEMEDELALLAGRIIPLHGRVKPTDFGVLDTTLQFLADIPTLGAARAWRENGFTGEFPSGTETDQAIREFMERLRNMPTEYFEAIIPRGVQLSEFAAAVVPKDTPPDVMEALREAGLRITIYGTNNNLDRQAATVRAAEAENKRRQILFQEDPTPPPPFYSALEEAIINAPQDKATGQQWLGILKNRGVKSEEIDWYELDSWLDDRTVTRQELLDYFRANQLEIDEFPIMGPPLAGGTPMPDLSEVSQLTEIEQRLIPALEARGLALSQDIMDADFGGRSRQWVMSLMEGAAEGVVDEMVQNMRLDPVSVRPGILKEGFSQWDIVAPADQPGPWRYRNEDYIVQRVTARNEQEARASAAAWVREEAYDRVLSIGWDEREDLFELLPAEIRKALSDMDDSIADDENDMRGRVLTDEWDGDLTDLPYEDNGLTMPGGENYRILRFALKVGEYYGAKRPSNQNMGFFDNSHMNNNLIFWMRVKDRVTNDGRKVFFIEEVQSDWHQKGRKFGYRDADSRPDMSGMREVPDAPFKTTWVNLALKRAARFAAENGYDSIAWTTGEVQRKRNSLDTYVRTLWAEPDGNWWKLEYELVNGTTGEQRVPDAELDAYIGDGLAKRVREHAASGRREGLMVGQEQLSLGGAMHVQIYDRNLPRAAKKMFGKYGARPKLVQMADADQAAIEGEVFETLELGGLDMARWTNWVTVLPEIMDEAGAPANVDEFIVREQLEAAVDHVKRRLLSNDHLVESFLKLPERDQRDYVRNEMLAFLELREKYRADPYAGGGATARANQIKRAAGVAREFVNQATIKMALTVNRDTPQMWEVPVTETLAEAAMAGQPLFQQGRRAPRGRIEMSAEQQGIRAFRIVLGEDANLSTALHELGHYYFELMADLAERPDAPEQVREDYRAMLRFLGVDSRDQVTRAHHERLARSWEAYLMEGRSPSIAMASVFGRMRAWLISVYRQIRRLNAPLNDEIRGVFDRMVATDEAIAAANTAAALDPMFKDAAEAGMTEQEFQDYQRIRNEALQSAQGELQRELMAVRTREAKAWWKRLREKTRREVEREVNEQRVYQVLAYLQGGKNADGSPLPEGQEAVKLDREALVAKYGKDFIKRLPRPYIYTRKDGVDPELVAEMFGFDSADQMIQEILSARPKKQLIEAETDARMKEQYPDPLLDGSLPEEATNAVMSDKAGHVLLKELNALEKRAGRPEASPMSIIRAAVERILAEKPVRAVDPRRYQSFAAQAGKRAQIAMVEGDYETARVEKQRQLLNHELYRQAMKMREEVETIRKYFQRLQKTSTRARLGKAGAQYLDQIDAITSRYELARVSNQKLDRRRSLRDFVDQLEDDGQEVGIDPVILDEARRVNYRDVPVQELRAAYDAARQLEHFARLKLRFKTRREQANWKDVKSQLIAAARRLPQERRPLDPNTIGWFKRAMSGIRDLDAAMLKMEQIVRWLDNDNPDGPWHRFFFNEFAEAQTAKLDLMHERFAELRRVIDQLSKETKLRLLDKVFIKSLGESVTRDFLVGFALNMGNASNKKKAIEGMQFTEDQVKEMLDQLTKEEWQLVQTIWDTFESLWPDIAALQKEMTGLEPAKVEAIPVETKFGTFRGGYYPVVYDPDKSKAGMAQENERLKTAGPFASGYSFATTARGHVKQRVENFTAAMRFSLDVVPNRLARHIHDLTHRQAVVNAHRILTDPEIKAALQDALGIEVERSMYPWLKRQANDSAFDVLDGTSGFKRIMERLRLNTSIVAMGLKMTTMMSQFGGYFDAAEMVGAKWMAVGLKEFYRNPRAAFRLASEKSGEIRYRFELKDLTVREQLQRLQGKVDWRSRATRFYFLNILVADKMVAVASWMGEYRKQIAAGAKEEVAVNAADAVIRLTQGAGGTKDLSAIQATENQLLRWMGMFYTYFNAKYNRIRSMGRRGKRVAKGELNELPLLLVQVWWGTFLPAVISEVLAGRGPGDDDENWALWAFQVWLEFPFMTVIGLRDVASPAIQNILPWRERPFPGRYQLTPVQQAGESVLRFGTTVAEGLQGEADLEEVMLRGFEAFGYAYGFPTSQAKITGRAILGMLEGDEPESTREAVRNLMFTPRD